MTASNTAPDIPNVLAPPPVIFLAAVSLGLLLQAVLPLQLSSNPRSLWLAGGILLAVGLALSGTMMWQFRRAATPVSPRHATQQLVVSGLYRFSRNPDYLGQIITEVGLALLLNTAWILVSLVPAVLLVRYAVIAREERYLEGRFGDAYRIYTRRVRRWF